MSTDERTPPGASGSHQAKGGPSRGSLTRRTLVKMGVRLAFVIFAMSGISYYQVMSTSTRRTLDELGNYARARGEREQWLFDLARDNHLAVETELVKRIHEYDGVDPAAEAERRYMLYPDGAMRTRPEVFDPERNAGTALLDLSRVDPDVLRRVLAAQDTIEPMGRAQHTRFQNLWVVMPENVSMGYWPEEPRWPFNQRASQDYTADSLYKNAGPERNPERRSLWSGVYLFRAAQVYMVSAVTPMYDGDRFLGVVGTDVTLTELLDRTVNVKAEGTYNLIVHEDGSLIAHPRLMKEIESDKGVNVKTLGDAGLLDIHRAALTLAGDSGIVEAEAENAYLGVVKFRGPRWYLVTVYPKEQARWAAYGTARFVLLGGLVSLVLETAVLFFVLRSQVQGPLKLLLRATGRVAAGERDVVLDAGRDDELGRLAASFNHMAEAVRRREDESERAEAAIAALNTELAQKVDDIGVLNEDLAQKVEDIGGLNTELAQKVDDIHALNIELGQVNTELAQKVDDIHALNIELGQVNTELAQKVDDIGVLNEDLAQKIEDIGGLNDELAQNLEREREKNRMLERLGRAVDLLSAPILEVWNDVIVLPVIGTIDDRRSAVMVEKLLEAVTRMRCHFVIIDVTGVESIDAAVAERLLAMVAAVELLGARAIMTGIQPGVAGTLVNLDVDFRALSTSRTVKDGVRLLMARGAGKAPAERAGARKGAARGNGA